MRPSARDRCAAGFTIVELIVVVIIIGIVAASAVPIYTAQGKRAVASEAIAALGSIREAQRLYKTEKGVFLRVRAGKIGNATTDTNPGLGLDLGESTFFSDFCFSVNLNNRYGFIAICNGGHRRNVAPRADDAANIIVRMRGNGQLRISLDGGTSYTRWE